MGPADRAAAGGAHVPDSGDERRRSSWAAQNGDEVRVSGRRQTADRASPWPPGRWARQRGGGRPRSGRGVEWQGGRKGPQREQVSQLVGSVTQALGAGAEGVDKGVVPDAEVECGPFIRGVDKGRIQEARGSPARPDLAGAGQNSGMRSRCPGSAPGWPRRQPGPGWRPPWQCGDRRRASPGRP